MPTPRSRRRNPEEFGSSNLTSRGMGGTHRSGCFLDLGTYDTARLADGLTGTTGDSCGATPANYTQAAHELALLMDTCFQSSPKDCANAMARDAATAVSQIKRLINSEHLIAAEAVFAAAKRVLPGAKKKELEGEYKRAVVIQKRREKHFCKSFPGDDWDNNNGTVSDRDSDSDVDHASHRPIRFDDLPGDVLGLVLHKLDPHTLGRVACVSREWRERVSSSEDVWRTFTIASFGDVTSRYKSSNKSLWYQLYASLHARLRKHAFPPVTGRAWCGKCRALRWHAPPDDALGPTRLRCGCVADSLLRRDDNTESRFSIEYNEAVARTASFRIASLTPAQAVRYLIRNSRRRVNRQKHTRSGSSAKSSSGSDDDTSSASSSSSAEEEESSDEIGGQARLWQFSQM